jgi:aspartyl-tRNA(Asn)/glutamyl-tRNA(Gln) amidotransferase subunit A
MEKLAFASIRELKTALDSKKISSTELLKFFIDRFETLDPKVGSALEVFKAETISARGSGQGTLAHIPGLIKDNISMEGRLATCGSKILATYTAPYDATVISRLKQEGALLIGRANMDEFAMGSSTETSAYQKTKNPWDASRVPGGSSGGSAAAVAAGLVPWALGSDTGGSVRQPAALCGIVGLRPTYGLVSRYGLIAYGSSLDQIGPLTRTVYDNALVLSAIAGHDMHDSSSRPVEKKDYTMGLDGKIPAGLRIGVIDNAVNAQGMDPEISAAVNEAITLLEKMGASIKRINLKTLEYTTATYFILSRAEAASNLARFDGVRYGLRDTKADSIARMYSGTRAQGFGTEVKTRIMVGNYVLSSGHAGEFYDNARKVRRLIRRELVDAFKDVDLMIMPTHPVPAFKFGAYDVDKLQMDLQDYFTCPMNVTGVPAISLPCGFTKSKLPIGFQLMGSYFSEELIYRVAHAYEQQTPWHTMHPEGF